jgi:O-antigen/teichoic acid export membrane protein
VILGLTIRFVQGALLARLLGVAEFGQLAAVSALVAIVARANDLGLPGAVSYHFRRTPGSLPSLLRHIGLNFAWCCLAGFLIALVAPYLPLPFASDLERSLWFRIAFGVLVAVSTPAIIIPGLVTAAGEYRSYVRLTNYDALAQAVLVLGACLVFGASYQHAVGALAVEQAVASLLFLLFVRRYRGRAPKVALSTRATYSYGFRLQLGVITKLLATRADLLIIAALLPVSQVGVYSIASAIRDLGLLPQAVYGAPFTNLVIDRSKEGGASDRVPVLTGLTLQVALSIAMFVGAAVLLPVLIPLVYGEEFRAAAGPAVVLFASVIFLAPAGLCWMTFNAKGRPDLTSWIQTGSGVLSPLSTFALVLAGYGLYGAAVGAVASAALGFALTIYFLTRMQAYRAVDYREGSRRARELLRVAAREARSRIARLLGRSGRDTSVPSDAK